MEYCIYWNNLSENAYLYGSQLSSLDGKTNFENPLMSPGLEIKKWVAMTNFQAHRTIPSLPRLRQGCNYSIYLGAESYPQNSLYIKIEFFNYYKESISNIVIKDRQGEFEFPIGTYNYEVSLINAGCEKIVFQYIKISDAEASENTGSESWEDLSNEELDVLFLENPIEDGHDLDSDILEKFSHIMVIDDIEEKRECYMAEEFSRKLLTYIQDVNPATIRFIGYGPISNLAALYYATCFLDNSTAYITDALYRAKEYRDSIKNPNISIEELLNSLSYLENINRYQIEFSAALEKTLRLYGANIYLRSLPYVK